MGDIVKPEFEHWQGPSPELEGYRKTLEQITENPHKGANWTVTADGLEPHILFDGTPHLINRSLTLGRLGPVGATMLIELGERAMFELLAETGYRHMYRLYPDTLERNRQRRNEENIT